MSVIVQTGDSQPLNEASPYTLFCKGSPKLLLECCTHIQIGDWQEPLAAQQRTQILEQNNQFAGRGLRVLGFAGKPLTHKLPEFSGHKKLRLRQNPDAIGRLIGKDKKR
jgi:Ca2+-transporting ATPase